MKIFYIFMKIDSKKNQTNSEHSKQLEHILHLNFKSNQIYVSSSLLIHCELK